MTQQLSMEKEELERAKVRRALGGFVRLFVCFFSKMMLPTHCRVWTDPVVNM